MAGKYFFKRRSDFLSLSGGSVTGDTYFDASLSANTFYSGSTPLENLFITLNDFSATTVSSGGGNVQVNNIGVDYEVSFSDSPSFNNLYTSGNTSASTIFVDGDIKPQTDNSSNLGTLFKRFRSLNTVNGIAKNFTATTKVTTPELELGNTIVTENNIVLSGNCVDGGEW